MKVDRKVDKAIIVGANIKMTAVREGQDLHSPFVESVLTEIRKAIESVPGVKVTAIDSDLDDKELEEVYTYSERHPERATTEHLVSKFGETLQPNLRLGIKNISQASVGLGPDCQRITNALLMVLDVDSLRCRSPYSGPVDDLIRRRPVVGILSEFFRHAQFMIDGKGVHHGRTRDPITQTWYETRAEWWKVNADRQCNEIFGCGYNEIVAILQREGS